MNIERYQHKKIKKRQAIIKQNKKLHNGGASMNITVERHCTPSESLKEALKEMQLMREGKKEKSSFWDMMKELEEDDD